MLRWVGLRDILVVILVCSTLAAVYGIVHDLITYSISEDYYTLFKFRQFNIPSTMENHLGAALVGIQATWWVGGLIGLNYAGILSARGPMDRADLKIPLIICLIATILGTVLGLVTGIGESSLEPVRIIHIGSYLGAVAGYAAGIVWILTHLSPMNSEEE